MNLIYEAPRKTAEVSDTFPHHKGDSSMNFFFPVEAAIDEVRDLHHAFEQFKDAVGVAFQCLRKWIRWSARRLIDTLIGFCVLKKKNYFKKSGSKNR